MGLTELRGSRGSGPQTPEGTFLSNDGRWRWNGHEWERVVPAPDWVAESLEQAPTEPLTALALQGDPTHAEDPRCTMTWKERLAILARRLRQPTYPANGRHSPRSGSRSQGFQRRALRALVFSVLGLLVLVGVRDLALSLTRPERPTTARPAAQQPSFPKEAAEALATRFTTTYLTYDQADPEARQRALEPYLGRDAVSDWNGQGSQSVLATYPSSTEVKSTSRALVTVQAEVSGTRWLYLAVPVAVQAGSLSLAGPPAFVSAPPVSKEQTGNDSRAVDGTLTEQVRPTIQNVFAAWAKGDQTQLAYYAAPGAQLPAAPGMASANVQDVKVFAGKGTMRDSLAKVTWGDAASSAQLTQTYSLRLVAVSGRWLIQSFGASA